VVGRRKKNRKSFREENKRKGEEEESDKQTICLWEGAREGSCSIKRRKEKMEKERKKERHYLEG